MCDISVLKHEVSISTVIIWQGTKVVRAAAGVSKSIFISSEGIGYWCGEGMGELKSVRESIVVCVSHTGSC